MKVQFVSSGHSELMDALGSMSSRVSATVQREALKAGAGLIAARASALAPRDPGAPDLADNINVATARSASGSGDVTVGIGSPRSFFYDWFQEFGTGQHGPRPFYRPALEQEGERAVKAVGSSLWEAIIRRGFGSTRIGQGSSESFAHPQAPPVMGGPGGGLL